MNLCSVDLRYHSTPWRQRLHSLNEINTSPHSIYALSYRFVMVIRPEHVDNTASSASRRHKGDPAVKNRIATISASSSTRAEAFEQPSSFSLSVPNKTYGHTVNFIQTLWHSEYLLENNDTACQLGRRPIGIYLMT